MKSVFSSIAMAFQTFSALPVPRVEWKQENMRYMLAALPLVGVFISLALWLWYLLCQWLTLGSVLYASLLTLLPILLSGGIHMDGFCDTVDALASHAPPQRKREILKDSSAGAFAVLYAGAYLLLFTALCTELPRSTAAVLSLGLHQVLSRVVGALCSALFSPSGEGLQQTFRDARSRWVTLLLGIWAVLCLAGLCAISVAEGALCAFVCVLCFLYLRTLAEEEFNGMSGDLAGYIITLAPLLMLLATVFVEKAVAL